ncbi:hypothetical protein COT78_02015 [Candidatus Berkelbacteria bacterium CG10_big_fil_rev_8_21_14_0_10_43_13]|uniref:Uncharacterized protein n=1 Tax=Candidatus Berkelbacteria bacterium CG10_big_fil_rev_8_21_14_0_10_43_13 TaxID=1974514 RepID=A0A2H0W6U3_9BACT|nr:MAG: hypothetical protein COT78_02015 [Candidatus Berkelbacteria bacterium CG10_big_fil_rev_8_21_14_0_10_43_13]
MLQIAKPDMDAICYFIESDNLDGVTQDVTQVDVDDAILRTYGGGFFWSDLSQTEKEDLCNWLEEYVARKGYRLEIKDGHCVIVTN